MKIKPYNPDDEGHRALPNERLPAWWVTEEDRHVSHVIPLDEVLGIEDGPAEADPEHRKVARNALRMRLHELLAAGLGAESLADHVVWDRQALAKQHELGTDTGGADDATLAAYRSFSLNHRLAVFSLQRLGQRPSHEWAPGLSPMGLTLDAAIWVAEDRKPRDRSSTDRWWQVVITDLQKVMSVVVHREL